VYEGVENLTADEGRHEKRFYELLFPKVKNLMDESKGGKMMFRSKYNKILCMCQSVKAGVPAAVLKKQQGYTKVYAWSKTFDVFEFSSSSCVVLSATKETPSARTVIQVVFSEVTITQSMLCNTQINYK
jgi:hypothetical protein